MSQLSHKRFAPENIKRTALAGYTVREQPRQSFQKHSVHKYGNGRSATSRKYRRHSTRCGSAGSYARTGEAHQISSEIEYGSSRKRETGRNEIRATAPPSPPRTSDKGNYPSKENSRRSLKPGVPSPYSERGTGHSCVRTVILSKKALSAPFCLNFIPVCQTRTESSSQKMNFELISL